ncbi:MAG TPA: hypothetical protein VFE53_16050 [Mucilaginibacter sp.]|jgi:hypothetical protein|nr:hypothetical protein [Mucilaginibacter sp.]
MKHIYQAIIGLVVVALLSQGCTTTTSINKCGPCPEIAEILPNLNFQLVSKTTGNNLFYGSAAPYQLNQLSMHHILNGKADSAYFRADTATQSFVVFVVPTQRKALMIDTVTMKIANLPADTLLFRTGVTSGCCPFLLLNSVSYDGTVVYNHGDGNKLVVLQK